MYLKRFAGYGDIYMTENPDDEDVGFSFDPVFKSIIFLPGSREDIFRETETFILIRGISFELKQLKT